MLGRRGLLVAPAATVAAWPSRAAAPPGELRFRIMRQGSSIGSHRVIFGEEGGLRSARTEVDIVVRLAGITVFRLAHRFEEVWDADRVVRVQSRFERNGRATAFSARAEGGRLRVDDGDGGRTLPSNAAPLTWWDHRRFDRPLFANDTGKPLRLEWTRTARPGGGVRWACIGDERGEGGYAADGDWLEWETEGEDGSRVTYARA